MSDYSESLKKAFLIIKEQEKTIEKLHSDIHSPIAIIGMGCRFPGGANTPEDFWRLLHESFDSSIDVPTTRWDIEKYYSPDPNAPGKMISRKSSFMDVAIDQFDAEFFGINPREAEFLDPQQRLLLEVSWEALLDAGIEPRTLMGSPTGVFIGIAGHDYGDLLGQVLEEKDIEAYLGTGNVASTASGRMSYVLGLQGPNEAIDTACSSSLVALHNACQSLRLGECNMALVGGVNLLLSPAVSIDFSQAHMIAPDGHCKTFDANADGYVRGEGCGIVVLKRLNDALQDNNHILAIIKGSAVNQDGASSGLTVPNGVAQEAVIRAALAQARLAPEEIDYIEAHGTGTRLGDPIEVNAIAQVFNGRQRPLTISTVKTNIGHLESAAGIAAIIKTVLALEHEKIPQHLHFKALNPAINLEAIPAQIPLTLMPWEKQTDRIRRAGVSSFGFSGTNAHIILEEAPTQDLTQVKPSLPKIIFNRKHYWAKALDKIKPIAQSLFYQQEWMPVTIELSPETCKVEGQWLLVNNEQDLSSIKTSMEKYFSVTDLNLISEDWQTQLQSSNYNGVVLFLKSNSQVNASDAVTNFYQLHLPFFQALVNAQREIRLLVVIQENNKFYELLEASLLGFLRTLSQEASSISVQLLEINGSENYGEIFSAALSKNKEYPVLKWLNDHFVTQQLIPLAEPEATPEKFIPAGLFLVTGGAGALGLVTIEKLIANGVKNFILTSHHPLNESTQNQLEQWRGLGVNIAHFVVDVANKDALRKIFEKIATQSIPLTGIFHIAGTLHDGLLRDLTWNDFAEVLSPKLQGAWNLHELVEEFKLNLNYFINYASISGVFGNIGQSNYAAANGFLNGLMQYRRSQGLTGLSIAWGPWNIGMGGATDSAEGALHNRMQEHGMNLLSAESGMNALFKIITQQNPEIIITDINWAKFLSNLPNISYYFQQVMLENKSGLDVVAEQERAAFLLNILLLDKDSRTARVEKQLIDWIKITMRADSTVEIQMDKTFQDLGFDSLLILELMSKTQRYFSNIVAIDVTNFTMNTNIKDYIATINQQIDNSSLGVIGSNKTEQVFETDTLDLNKAIFNASELQHESINAGPNIILARKKLRVLFLHGTGINAALTKEIMSLSHWLDILDNRIEWVFIDGPYKTSPMPLNFISLYMAKKYFKNEKYGRWDLYRGYGQNLTPEMQQNIQFVLPLLENISDEDIASIASGTMDLSALMIEEPIPGETLWRAFAYEQDQHGLPNFPASFQHSLDYVKDIYQYYGPFDGIAGMCEGAATTSIFVRQLEQGQIIIPDNRLKFLLSFSGWIGQGEGIEARYYTNPARIKLPSMHICGATDSEYAKNIFSKNVDLFEQPIVAWHAAGHVIPELKQELKTQVIDFLQRFLNDKL